jgi:hypothetical protein
MNNILSRVITGIIGLISGVIFSILISYLSAYIVNATVPDGGGMMSGPGLTYAIFYIFGGILGSCVGTAIGVSQFKVLKSLALGAGVTFLLRWSSLAIHKTLSAPLFIFDFQFLFKFQRAFS